MFVQWSPYTLTTTQRLNNQTPAGIFTGALLRISEDLQFTTCGYADIFPHRAWGDASIDEQIRLLTDGHPLHLVQVSLEKARRDLQARQRGESLYFEKVISSNVLISDVSDVTSDKMKFWSDSQVTHLKIKIGGNLIQEAEQLNARDWSSFRLRLDMNCLHTEATVVLFLDQLNSAVRRCIEYIEDPCPWDLSVWQRLQAKVPLALDQPVTLENCSHQTAFSYLILKPARMTLNNMEDVVSRSQAKIVLTSSMDHQVGILHAVAEKTYLSRKYPDRIHSVGGFLTQSLFVDFPLFNDLEYLASGFKTPSNGYGIGLETSLSKLDWRSL